MLERIIAYNSKTMTIFYLLVIQEVNKHTALSKCIDTDCSIVLDNYVYMHTH